MTQQPQEANISLSLLESKCLQFALSEYGLSNQSVVPATGYEFTLSMGFSLIEPAPAKHIRIHLLCKLFEKKSEQLKLEIASLHASCTFFIQNFEHIIKRDKTKNKVIIPDTLIELCNGLTLGIVRGMFVVKLENTLYQNALLPLIDLQALKSINAHGPIPPDTSTTPAPPTILL